MTSGTPAQVGVVAWLDDRGRLVRLEGVGNSGTVMPGRAIPDSWQPLYPSAALAHRVEQLEAAIKAADERLSGIQHYAKCATARGEAARLRLDLAALSGVSP